MADDEKQKKFKWWEIVLIVIGVIVLCIVSFFVGTRIVVAYDYFTQSAGSMAPRHTVPSEGTVSVVWPQDPLYATYNSGETDPLQRPYVIINDKYNINYNEIPKDIEFTLVLDRDKYPDTTFDDVRDIIANSRQTPRQFGDDEQPLHNEDDELEYDVHKPSWSAGQTRQ